MGSQRPVAPPAEGASSNASMASSLLSVTWPQNNLITPHPARRYDGKIRQLVTQRSLPVVVRLLEQQVGPVTLHGARAGVHAWTLDFELNREARQLRLPIALDEPGTQGRSRRALQQVNAANQRYFAERGLNRFALHPSAQLTLGRDLPASMFEALPDHVALGFARGGMCAEVSRREQRYQIDLDRRQSAQLAAEIVAALSYYYEPDVDGGTAIADVALNDGDFLARRRDDGSFALRLTQLRAREPGIEPHRLLLYLVQLVAYEFWHQLDTRLGIPVVASNPQLAFAGLVRGRSYRALDLGHDAAKGESEALGWITSFGRSAAGRSYRPWVERFVAGELPLEIGADLRERWWKLAPLEQRRQLLELRRRRAAEAEAEAVEPAIDAIESLLDALHARTGVVPAQLSSSVNSWTPQQWAARAQRAGLPPERQPQLVRELLANWPYRDWDDLARRVPRAELLRESARDDDRAVDDRPFGNVVAEADVGTTRALPPLPSAPLRRPLANAELYDPLELPRHLHAAAARAFPSFEQYMDEALHDPAWGYYARAVSIGRRGHFTTHPEALSPHYGSWVARWVYDAWRQLVDAGELSDAAAFAVVEFGAGNGRLARDFLDALKPAAQPPRGVDARRWATFAARVQYHIYERSSALRRKQHELLTDEARVAPGDARTPERCLAREFPEGLRGVVLSNELPDAFGSHKVLLTARGDAFAALVVPRIEAELCHALGRPLASTIARVDARLRRAFGVSPGRGAEPRAHYLDASTYSSLMRELAEHSPEARAALLQQLWFQESYVSASCFPELAEHLRQNAQQYALALAAADSGVVTYVNLHANSFMRGVAASLRRGFVLTIDYGDSTWGLIRGARRGDFRLRIYGDASDPWLLRPNDPYALPGLQDMTADVNFTDLAGAARRGGLEVVHFGLESDLVGEELAPLLAQAEREPFDELIGNPVFKLLVAGTSKLDAGGAARLQLPQPLCYDSGSLPPERRAAVAAIQSRLAGASRRSTTP